MRLGIGLLQVGDQLLSLGDHLQESATRVEVLLVFLQMQGEAFNLFSKEGDLIFWGPRVLLVPLDFFGDSIFLLVRQRHSVIQPYSRVFLQEGTKVRYKKNITYPPYHDSLFLTRCPKNVSMMCPNPADNLNKENALQLEFLVRKPGKKGLSNVLRIDANTSMAKAVLGPATLTGLAGQGVLNAIFSDPPKDSIDIRFDSGKGVVRLHVKNQAGITLNGNGLGKDVIALPANSGDCTLNIRGFQLLVRAQGH